MLIYINIITNNLKYIYRPKITFSNFGEKIKPIIFRILFFYLIDPILENNPVAPKRFALGWGLLIAFYFYPYLLLFFFFLIIEYFFQC